MDNNSLVKSDPNHSLTLQKVADGLFKSGLFPNAKNSFGAFAIVEYGHELGIPPMMALKNINIISGQLACNAQLMLSIAMSRGVTYTVIKETDRGAEIEFRRGDIKYIATFTEEDAKAAGLTCKDNWKKYARDMFFWRAVAKGIRRIAPDAVLGLYTKDEISNGEVVDIGTPEKENIVDMIIVDDKKDDVPNFTPPPEEQATQGNIASSEVTSCVHVVFQKITAVSSKEGTTNGKKWKAFFIETATGDRYGTFSESLADVANSFVQSGDLAEIHWKQGKKGKEVTDLILDVAKNNEDAA